MSLKSFRPPFSKGGADPTRGALVALRRERNLPHRRSSGAHCYAVVRMRRLSFVSFSCFKMELGLSACREPFRQGDFDWVYLHAEYFCASVVKRKAENDSEQHYVEKRGASKWDPCFCAMLLCKTEEIQ